MTTVNQLVSQMVGNSLTNIETWGGILYNIKSYGAIGDGITDNTAVINSAKASGFVVYVPEGDYLTTLGVGDLTFYYFGPGRIITNDSAANHKRANRNISMTSPPSTWQQGNGIVDDFDGDFLSPENEEIYVTGLTTVGNPLNGDGYIQYNQASPYYKRVFFTSGKNANPYNNVDRTGWAVNNINIFHGGKGDAYAYNSSVFVNNADSSILKCQGQPAGGILNGSTQAGADKVVLNPLEIHLHDNNYDVVGKGLILNFDRNNHTETDTQYWVGARMQSLGTQAAGAGYQLIGPWDVGFDTTGATVQRAISLKEDQEINFDAVTGYHLPANQWSAGLTIAIGDYIYNAQKIYQATTAGTTGATPPTHTTGAVSDGGVTWQYITTNDYKSHAKTFGETKMKKNSSSGLLETYVASTLVVSKNANQVNHYKRTVGTSFASTVQSITTTTVLTGDSQIVIVDATSTNPTISLPLGNTWGSNKTAKVTIKRTDGSANTVTIQTQGADTIDGGASITLPASSYKEFISDGTSAWYSL